MSSRTGLKNLLRDTPKDMPHRRHQPHPHHRHRFTVAEGKVVTDDHPSR